MFGISKAFLSWTASMWIEVIILAQQIPWITIEFPTQRRASNAGYSAVGSRATNRAVFYDTSASSTTTTASESDPAGGAAVGAAQHGGGGLGLHQRVRVTSSSRLSRSRSLDKGRHNAPLRSRSLDCGGERRSSPDEVR